MRAQSAERGAVCNLQAGNLQASPREAYSFHILRAHLTGFVPLTWPQFRLKAAYMRFTRNA